MKYVKTKIKKKLALRTRKKILPLRKVQEQRYLLRQSISKKLSAMEKKIKELKEDREKIDSNLAPAFEKYGNRRKLTDGTIVNRKVIDVDDRVATHKGQLIQSGYSYPKYDEISGE